MLFVTQVQNNNKEDACSKVLKAWKEPQNKVFVFKAIEEIDDVQGFYEAMFPFLGKPELYAEDAKISSRDNQRTDKVWMEVRYDPSVQNAYRHSSNAQPLHTDGSYIPSFPSTLMCCVANTSDGGETVFIDSEVIAKHLQLTNPNLFESLTTTEIPHMRSGDSRTEKPLYQVDNKWFVNWNYYCVSDDISKEKKYLVEEFQNYLLNLKKTDVSSQILEVKLDPGDGVIWKDDLVLHGRNGFNATKESERFIWKCAISVGDIT